MRITKNKWKWIKFWGHRYLMVSPFNLKIRYILYHRRFFNIAEWDKYFNEEKIQRLKYI